MTREKWLFEITPKNNLFDLNLKEVWQYRDLLMLFVKRDVVTVYKQTILGPLWYLIQPLFTSVIFTLVFNNIAGISTGSVPPFLFNLAGVTVWNYFKECLTATSDTFKKNEAIFGKVYFSKSHNANVYSRFKFIEIWNSDIYIYMFLFVLLYSGSSNYAE